MLVRKTTGAGRSWTYCCWALADNKGTACTAATSRSAKEEAGRSTHHHVPVIATLQKQMHGSQRPRASKKINCPNTALSGAIGRATRLARDDVPICWLPWERRVYARPASSPSHTNIPNLTHFRNSKSTRAAGKGRRHILSKHSLLSASTTLRISQ